MARYFKAEDVTPYLTKYIPSVEAVERSKIDKAIEEIEQLKHKNTDIEGYRWWNNAIENVLHILKEI